MSGSRRGFTIVELVVVMALVAILAAVGVSFSRPSSELRAANAVRGLLLFARTQALWQGVAVAVTPLPLGGGFTVAHGPFDEGSACSGGQVMNRLLLSDYPGVRVTTGFANGGLTWLPTGSGRTCEGGGVISTTLTLAGFRGAAEVIVSSLGRVRVERAP